MKQSSDLMNFLSGHMVFTKTQLVRAIKLFTGNGPTTLKHLSRIGIVRAVDVKELSKLSIFEDEVEFLNLKDTRSIYRVCANHEISATLIQSSKKMTVHQLLLAEVNLRLFESNIKSLILNESFFRSIPKNRQLYFEDYFPDMYVIHGGRQVIIEVERFAKPSTVYYKRADQIYSNPQVHFIFVATNKKVHNTHKKRIGFLKNATSVLLNGDFYKIGSIIKGEMNEHQSGGEF